MTTATQSTDKALRSKALAALREGRVCVTRADKADPETGTLRPQLVEAAVRSSRPGDRVYAVDMVGGKWLCTCQSGNSGDLCAHVAAVQMVTGGER
jgi:hypothetical protein